MTDLDDRPRHLRRLAERARPRPIAWNSWQPRTAARLGVMLAVCSAAAAFAVAISEARGHQIDFDIYRMGAGQVLGQHLYDTRLARSLMGGGRGMQFTYPPFAALLFWPFTHLTVITGQLAWSVLNLSLLAALAALSIHAVQPEWSLRRIWALASIALFPVLWLNPDALTMAYGQINFLIAVLVLLDLTTTVRWGSGSRTLPRGILLGVAAAIKLTPLIFIPFLLVTRQFRAGITALATFLFCFLSMFAIAPYSSWTYWSTEIVNPKRSGNLLYVSNQDLRSALQRMIGAQPGLVLVGLLTAAFAAAGLALAAWAYRASSPLLALLLCAATGLVVSPVSWAHHYVWIVPVLGWLALGPDRPRGGHWWALGVAVLFWAAPIWWVPNPQRVTGGPLTLVAGDAFFLAAVAFLVGTAGMLLYRTRPK